MSELVKCFVALTLLIASAPAAADAKLPRLWGSYGGPPCFGDHRIRWMEELVGRPQTVVVDFLAADSWRDMVSTAHLLARCHPAGRGKRLVVSVPMVPRNAASELPLVAQGEKREVFEKIARALIAGGHPDAIIRIGWEFNGNWYAWQSRGREETWKGAWRQIVTAMRSVDRQAFLFDWSYSLSDYDPYPFELAYPGDDVVDILGVDFYNQSWLKEGVSEERRWERFLKAPRGLAWLSKFASERDKWISLPEWGTGYRPDGHGGGDSAVFVTNTLGWIAANRVLYQSYWNYPASDYRAELKADDLTKARAAYSSGMRAMLGQMPKSD